MSGPALKMLSSTPGQSCAAAKPSSMMAHGGHHRHPHNPCDALRFAGAVVVGDDGHHAVVQPDERHDDEALHLEVDAEHRHGVLEKAMRMRFMQKVMTLPTEVMAMEGMPTW